MKLLIERYTGPMFSPKRSCSDGRVRTTDSVWGEIGRHIFCYPRGYLTQEAN